MCNTTRDLPIVQSFTSIIVIYIYRQVYDRTCTFLSQRYTVASGRQVIVAASATTTKKGGGGKQGR